MRRHCWRPDLARPTRLEWRYPKVRYQRGNKVEHALGNHRHRWPEVTCAQRYPRGRIVFGVVLAADQTGLELRLVIHDPCEQTCVGSWVEEAAINAMRRRYDEFRFTLGHFYQPFPR